MFERLVANASPLIFLSRVNGYDWLLSLSLESVIVPEPVIAEIEAGSDGAEVLAQIRRYERFMVVAGREVAQVVAAWDLGAGETHVINQCLQSPGSTALLDDRLGRQCSQSLGIRPIGTLGVVLAAKRLGLVAAARPVVSQLIAHRLYLSPDLIAEALREVGE